MTKRLPPERIAEIEAIAAAEMDLCDLELLDHIEAIESELKYTVAAWHDSQNELAEAKLEIARLKKTEDQLQELAWKYAELCK